jgi:hypothetical protein
MDGPNTWPQPEVSFPLQSEASKLQATSQVLGHCIYNHVEISSNTTHNSASFEWREGLYHNWLQVSGQPSEIGGQWAVRYDVAMRNRSGESRVVATNDYVSTRAEHIAPSEWLPEHVSLLATMSRLIKRLELTEDTTADRADNSLSSFAQGLLSRIRRSKRQ